MRILSINSTPIAEIPYLNAGRGPGGYYETTLPVLEATVDGLPENIDAFVVTGDLQGREDFQDAAGGPLRLLGEALPRRLAAELLPRWQYPPAPRMAALLAGDFYTVPNLDRRGGSGDVSEVWKAFGDQFAWVAGVAGNHDTFGPHGEARPRFSDARTHYLDGAMVEVGGMRIAGLGGIIGNPRKRQRRSLEDYLAQLELLLFEAPDIVLLHDGPDDPAHHGRGWPPVRELIEQHAPTLIVRGHAHWENPLAEFENGGQVLNVDARLVLLRSRDA